MAKKNGGKKNKAARKNTTKKTTSYPSNTPSVSGSNHSSTERLPLDTSLETDMTQPEKKESIKNEDANGAENLEQVTANEELVPKKEIIVPEKANEMGNAKVEEIVSNISEDINVEQGESNMSLKQIKADGDRHEDEKAQEIELEKAKAVEELVEPESEKTIKRVVLELTEPEEVNTAEEANLELIELEEAGIPKETKSQTVEVEKVEGVKEEKPELIELGEAKNAQDNTELIKSGETDAVEEDKPKSVETKKTQVFEHVKSELIESEKDEETKLQSAEIEKVKSIEEVKPELSETEEVKTTEEDKPESIKTKTAEIVNEVRLESVQSGKAKTELKEQQEIKIGTAESENAKIIEENKTELVESEETETEDAKAGVFELKKVDPTETKTEGIQLEKAKTIEIEGTKSDQVDGENTKSEKPLTKEIDLAQPVGTDKLFEHKHSINSEETENEMAVKEVKNSTLMTKEDKPLPKIENEYKAKQHDTQTAENKNVSSIKESSSFLTETASSTIKSAANGEDNKSFLKRSRSAIGSIRSPQKNLARRKSQILGLFKKGEKEIDTPPVPSLPEKLAEQPKTEKKLKSRKSWMFWKSSKPTVQS